MPSPLLPSLLSLLLPLLLIPGCPKDPQVVPPDTSETGDDALATDDDGDWFSEEQGDCDDGDAATFPGAPEACDGEDQDCDGQIDEDFDDLNGDGQPDCAGTEVCDGVDNDLDGLVDEDMTDTDGDGTCDGLDTEACDGVDNDGDGETDEGIDTDGDGTSDCVEVEPCDGRDNDGDGRVDELSDTDGDGFNACGSNGKATDCDDGDPATFPGATEVCGDGKDNDCDDTVVTCPPLGENALSGAREKITGSEFEDRLGNALAVSAGFDGNDVGGLVVAAANNSYNGAYAGAVYLLPGPMITSDAVDDAARTWWAGAEGDQLGWSVAAVGDVDEDGYDDLLLGAPGETSAGRNAGAAFLVNGDPTTTGKQNIDAVGLQLTAESDADQAGWSVAGAGDVNGDGFPDLLVGAPGGDMGAAGAGQAYLISGPVETTRTLASSTARFTGVTRGDLTGYAVSSAGDVDGDGFSDVLVGAPQDAPNTSLVAAGSAWLFLGPTSGNQSVDDADVWYYGTTAGIATGAALCSAGDTDSDGKDEVLLAAPGIYTVGSAFERGWVFLFRDPLKKTSYGVAYADLVLKGIDNPDEIGISLAGGEDVDGDGVDDFLVGSGRGDAAYLFLGPGDSGFVGADTADGVYTAEASGDLEDSAVALGDVTGDDFADLLFGARLESTGGNNAGAVYLFWGGPGF